MWVLVTCLIAVTSAFDDHFNHCFVVLKDVEHRTEFRRLRVRRNIINITKFKSVVLDWNLGLVCGCACLVVCHATGFPVLYPWISLVGSGRRMEHFNHEIPKIESWNPILA